MEGPPSGRQARQVWGKNALTFIDWDHLEEGTAVLRKAAGVSQLIEGDKYPTVSLIMPSIFKLISDSSRQPPLTFSNRAKPGEIGCDRNVPRKVSHDALRGKIQEARIEYNTQLRNRFDGKLNHLDSGLTRPAL